jgi:hypothetical protein
MSYELSRNKTKHKCVCTFTPTFVPFSLAMVDGDMEMESDIRIR